MSKLSHKIALVAASMDVKETLWNDEAESFYHVCISEYGSKIGNRAMREPRRAPLGTKIASLVLMLTSTVAHPLPTPLLTLAHPAFPIKQPCSPFRTETDFLDVRIGV
jgi:hypothetical protein